MKILINSVIVLLLITASSICMADITVSFKQHSYPFNKEVKLVDLVYIRGISEQNNTISQITVDTSKHPKELTKANISSYLTNTSFIWKGKERITPSSFIKSTIDKTELQLKAKSCLSDSLSQLNYEHFLKLRVNNSPSKINVSNLNYQLGCKLLKKPKANNVAKTIPVKILVIQNGNTTVSKTYWFDVNIRLPVLVADKDIDAGTLITEESYQRKYEILSGINKSYLDVNSRGVLEGYVAEKHIKQNSPLTHSDLIKKPDVINNEFVMLNYNKGNFSIRMKVRAREHGYINDLVQVLVPSSKELLVATVTGIGELTINEN